MENSSKISPENTFEIALSLNNFAGLLQEKGDLTAAEPLYRESFEILNDNCEKNIEIAEVLENLGFLFHYTGKARRSDSNLERGISDPQ